MERFLQNVLEIPGISNMNLQITVVCQSLINPPPGRMFQVEIQIEELDVILQIVELSPIILINCRFISKNKQQIVSGSPIWN